MKNIKVWIKLALLLLIQCELIAMEPVWYEASDSVKYLIETEEKFNWYQAWNECARYDAELIAIESEEQNRVIIKLLRGLNDKTKNLWIGGNVIYDKISFHWANNEQEFTFSNWSFDELDKLATRKQCVYIMKHRKNMPWNIVNCDAKEFGFICKEIITSGVTEYAENFKEKVVLSGQMYNGSIYGLIG
ncbi:lectin subunit alpha-like [Lucilia cuprina]|uniref:lectin subunit alpha-like n=1 Tax=Lucilia cuprina TaxID=7375 RepID=UPI001F05B437|nr:lectin subunit alpha-like [Lucilia cuprina]